MSADTPMNDPMATVLRLQRATNDHDLAALTACFAEDYVNETPVHPSRGFMRTRAGAEELGRILAAVPDLRSAMVSSVVSGDAVGQSGRGPARVATARRTTCAGSPSRPSVTA